MKEVKLQCSNCGSAEQGEALYYSRTQSPKILCIYCAIEESEYERVDGEVGDMATIENGKYVPIKKER